MKLYSIVTTRNRRGQIVVKIFAADGSLFDEASFVSHRDALEWIDHHLQDLEPVE